METMTENRLSGVFTFYWGDNFKEKKHGLGWLIEYRGITTPVTFKHEGASLMAMYADPLEEFIAVLFIPIFVSWIPEMHFSMLNIMWAGLE